MNNKTKMKKKKKKNNHFYAAARPSSRVQVEKRMKGK
jgi:stalled ribosome alternative rescue factor ArfA